MNVRRIAMCSSTILFAFALSLASQAEPVVFRDAQGRFLSVDAAGAIRPGAKVPNEKETFNLSTDGRRVSLGGKAFGVSIQKGQAFFLDAQGHRVFPPGDATVDVYRVTPTPEAIRTMLTSLLQDAASKELEGKKYDKTRRKKKEKFVDLPAPTLKDWGRKKRHRVLSTHEETRVEAELDGPLKIEVEALPYLRRFDQDDSRLLLFQVRADVPAKGRVRYAVPNVLDASTSFRARAALSVAGQVPEVYSAGDLQRRPPELLGLDIRVVSLDLGNDVLDAARKPIRDLINRELRRREPQIREKANKSIVKAIAKLPGLNLGEKEEKKKTADKRK